MHDRDHRPRLPIERRPTTRRPSRFRLARPRRSCRRARGRSRRRADRGRGRRRRRARYGPNKLAEEAKEPGWKAFLRQYRDLMQLVLVGAALVSIVALQDVSTGLVDPRPDRAQRHDGAAPGGQGGRERRRPPPDADHDGQRPPRRRAWSRCRPRSSCPATSSAFEAGDKVPADGRILVAATLEIEEAGLTGESTPVSEGRRAGRRASTSRSATGSTWPT